MHSAQHPSYLAALAAEREVYANCLDVHRLPDAFHYWSNRHLLPKLLPHDFRSPDDMFLKVLRKQCDTQGSPCFLSIGAGNGDLELSLARGQAAARAASISTPPKTGIAPLSFASTFAANSSWPLAD